MPNLTSMASIQSILHTPWNIQQADSAVVSTPTGTLFILGLFYKYVKTAMGLGSHPLLYDLI
jgi:hypothetical protein